MQATAAMNGKQQQSQPNGNAQHLILSPDASFDRPELAFFDGMTPAQFEQLILLQGSMQCMDPSFQPLSPIAPFSPMDVSGLAPTAFYSKGHEFVSLNQVAGDPDYLKMALDQQHSQISANLRLSHLRRFSMDSFHPSVQSPQSFDSLNDYESQIGSFLAASPEILMSPSHQAVSSVSSDFFFNPAVSPVATNSVPLWSTEACDVVHASNQYQNHSSAFLSQNTFGNYGQISESLISNLNSATTGVDEHCVKDESPDSPASVLSNGLLKIDTSVVTSSRKRVQIEEESDLSLRRASTSQIVTPLSAAPTPKRSRANSTPGSVPTTRGANGGRVFHCPYEGCSKTFPRQYNLKSHMFCHSGERPHACTMCASSFARKHDLQRHVRTLHATDRPFRCDNCDQSFTQMEQLKRHQIQEKQMLANGGKIGDMVVDGKSDDEDDEDYC